uniref:hypothetical protein n=1 Tax=uncultured Allisonella sp. TaxID=339338 RepID=UPI00280424AF|nr:hypothetical protein [uncultured Allisonella sp.]
MPAEAAVQSELLVVTKMGQTVTDDFDVKNCTNPAVQEIGSTAAADTDDVTEVDSKNITGTFTLGGDENHVAEANGIWVQDKYPGKVNLPDGLQITLTSDGNNYNTTGIYLEGVDTNKDPKEVMTNRRMPMLNFRPMGTRFPIPGWRWETTLLLQ